VLQPNRHLDELRWTNGSRLRGDDVNQMEIVLKNSYFKFNDHPRTNNKNHSTEARRRLVESAPFFLELPLCPQLNLHHK
jgi:hypothetical protein